jgi:hypothetical protein
MGRDTKTFENPCLNSLNYLILKKLESLVAKIVVVLGVFVWVPTKVEPMDDLLPLGLWQLPGLQQHLSDLVFGFGQFSRQVFLVVLIVHFLLESKWQFARLLTAENDNGHTIGHNTRVKNPGEGAIECFA